jgi:UTP:GlnB (protein PII) uridylyltransferase
MFCRNTQGSIMRNHYKGVFTECYNTSAIAEKLDFFRREINSSTQTTDYILSQNKFLLEELVITICSKYIDEINAKHQTYDFCVASIGGLARGEVFPRSDIDLVFIDEGRSDLVTHFQAIKSNLTWIQQQCGSFGLDISILNIHEIENASHKDLTALIRRRLLFGNVNVFDRFAERYDDHVRQNGKVLAIAKYDERNLVISKNKLALCDNINVNVKNSFGGLRDFHSVSWMWRFARHSISKNVIRSLYQSLDAAGQALYDLPTNYALLRELRCRIHLVANSYENSVTEDNIDAVMRQLVLHTAWRFPSKFAFVETLKKTIGQTGRLAAGARRHIYNHLMSNTARPPAS